MNMHSNRSSETDFKLWITGTHLSWDLGPLRPTECIWTIRYTIRGWFTAGPIRTMTAGMTRNGRRGQERCAAGQRRQWVGHQPWMKTVCRVGIFSHVLCDLGFIPTKKKWPWRDNLRLCQWVLFILCWIRMKCGLRLHVSVWWGKEVYKYFLSWHLLSLFC